MTNKTDEKPIAIEGGFVILPGQILEGGLILTKKTKIDYAGSLKKFDRAKYRVIDARGMVVSPGLIDAHTHLGVYAEGTGESGEDGNEMIDPVTPHVRAVDAIDPADKAFCEAREAGITTVMITPGSANVVGGQICVAKTFGRTADEMVIEQYIGQKMATGENPKRVYGAQKKAPMTRMGIAATLRQALVEAQNYREKQKKSKKDAVRERNLKYESLIPVLEGKIPARVHAHRADDIMTAVRIAEEFKLKLVIEHGTEAYKVADILAAKKIPLNIGPSSTSRSKVELKDLIRDNAARCIIAGCHVSLITDHPVMPIADLRTEASKLVRDYAVPMDVVQATITTNPAITLGVEKRVGEISKGKDADIAIYNGHPTDPSSLCQMTLVNGQVVYHREGF